LGVKHSQRTFLRSKKALVVSIVSALLVSGLCASASLASRAATITASSFNRNFTVMVSLKSIAAMGKGKIGVILPDTVSSTRYTEFDAPYLKEAFTKAGLTSSDFTIQNAQGSDSTELTDAQADIANGATVLVMDPLDSGVGAQIEKYAKSHGAKVIDYDRLTLGGSRAYYVSFNNVKVGNLLGQGLVSCVASWHVASPQVIVMRGAPTDNNATLFYQGYSAILDPLFKSGKWVDVSNPAGTWTPTVAETEFQQAFTAHKTANAALIPNDENGAPIISYLQNQGLKPDTFPMTGQDATLTGLQNIISGYQCGTVYKPIYLEAQAAAALAIYLRAGQTPPAALANGKTADTVGHVEVPSVLLPPEWVTPQNMEMTVIADNFVPAKQLCAGKFAADCTKYGIH
jgi:D-xylose transport system substrate-binding protein